MTKRVFLTVQLAFEVSNDDIDAIIEEKETILCDIGNMFCTTMTVTEVETVIEDIQAVSV